MKKNKNKKIKKENTLLLLQKKAELLKNIKEKFDILSSERKSEDEICNKKEDFIQSNNSDKNLILKETEGNSKIIEELNNDIENQEKIEYNKEIKNNDDICNSKKEEKAKEEFDINLLREKFKGKWVLDSCKIGDDDYIDLFILAKFENKEIIDKNYYEIYYFKDDKVKKYQYMEINYKEDDNEKKYINEIEIIAFYNIIDENTIKIKIESGKKKIFINEEEKISNVSNIDKEIIINYKFQDDKLILYNTEDEEIRILGRYNADQSINS